MLASGDPGFFGIVRALRARGLSPSVIPATSSVTLAFARLGLDWDDALVVSAHGRDPKHALAAALAHPKAAILTAPRTATARDLGAELLAAGKRVYVAECLGTAQERITDLAAEPAEPARNFAEPNILITVDPEAAGSQPAPSATLAGRPPGRPGRLGAARGRVRAPRLDDHQGGGPRADPGPARARPRPRHLGRGRGLGLGGGGMRPVRRLGDRGRGRPGPVRPDPPERRPPRRPPAGMPGPRAGGAHWPAARGRGLRRRRRPNRAGRRRQDRQPRPRRGHAGRRPAGRGDQRPAHRPGLPPRGRPAPGVPPGPPPTGQRVQLRLAAQNPVFVLWAQR